MMHISMEELVDLALKFKLMSWHAALFHLELPETSNPQHPLVRADIQYDRGVSTVIWYTRYI